MAVARNEPFFITASQHPRDCFMYELESISNRFETGGGVDCCILSGRGSRHDTAMAIHLFPSSFRCDCGHESHFSERTVREMRQMSRRRRQLLMDSETDEHTIEFEGGRAVAVICPRLGRRTIGADD